MITLVLSPPRLRPSACARAERSAPIFLHAPRSGGVLVGADDGGVDQHAPHVRKRRVGGQRLE
jgi:hypothetical protein